MNTLPCLVPISYFPSIQYLQCVFRHSHIVLEAHENYQKQTFRNRTHILTANGVECLTVPVLRSNSKQLIRDVLIDNSTRWYARHWRAIQSAYGKAPFFIYFQDAVHDILFQKHIYLFELNQNILTLCLHLWKQQRSISQSDTYQKEVINMIIDYRQLIENQSFNAPIPYYKQCFGEEFTPNLSGLDRLFCAGTLPFWDFGQKIE